MGKRDSPGGVRSLAHASCSSFRNAVEPVRFEDFLDHRPCCLLPIESHQRQLQNHLIYFSLPVASPHSSSTKHPKPKFDVPTQFAFKNEPTPSNENQRFAICLITPTTAAMQTEKMEMQDVI